MKSTTTTTRLWRNVSRRVRCTNCDNWVSIPTRTRWTTTTSTTTTTRLWRSVSSQVRCTSCDNQVAAPTRTRQILRISLMPRRFLLKPPTPGATRSRAVQEGENRTVSLTSSRRTWQVYVIIYRDGGQRSDHFQIGTTGADRIAHDGGRARGGGSDNEGGGGILLQHDVGTGLRYELRQRAAVYR